MRKHYILDTNVLLHDPGALFSFQDNDVLLPIQVVEEVDHFKRQQSELGRNARTVSKLLDDLRSRGSLSDGVQLEGGGVLRVSVDKPDDQRMPAGLEDTVDNALLAVALDFKARDPEHPVIIVTKDTNLRIKADALGIQAEDFEAGRVALDEVYSGERELSIDSSALERLKESGEIELPEGEFLPNEYVHLTAGSNGGSPCLARVDTQQGTLHTLLSVDAATLGLRPRNKEQHFAIDALLDPALRLVTLMGKAGTGKTFLAVAAGLLHVEEGRYSRLLVSRPILPVGRDVGFLPGTIENKLAPWMQPIHDNLLLLLERSSGKDAAASLARLVRDGVVGIEPVTYIRGRSISDQYIVIDEAQNLTPLEVKTIVTRVGEGTKIVLTGDIDQIDNPYIDALSNGFVHVVQKFMPSEMAAHVRLRKGERSALAELAANVL